MSAYRALARKYRSRNFAELIGQDVLVRTLSSAIAHNRIHHAYMFTGIRGTGKTSTARILAKAINYAGPDGKGGPTVGPTDDCDICRAVGEDRHPDVIEIDAASNTGIDDVRQIIENVRYAPVQARYKVFIIDEVHMLSKAAFNALLKTLEEPPPHVVFMLATTEIRKVPATILSRCQRFDLRRIDVPTLVAHYRKIAEAEQVAVTDEALYLIAQAADGSVRDGLSIFDQAIAQADRQEITAESVEAMLGHADSSAVAEIFAQIMRGEMPEVLQKLERLYKAGTDPSAFLDDLLNAAHLVTRIKVAPQLAEDMTIPAGLRGTAGKLAGEFKLSSLSRIWQMLLKAVPEVANAPQPQQALEMALIRIGFAAPLPPLEDLLKRYQNVAESGDAASAPVPSGSPPGGSPAPATVAQRRLVAVASHAVATKPVVEERQPEIARTPVAVEDFMALVKLCEANNEPMLAADLRVNARLVKFAQGQLHIALLPGAAKDLVTILPRKLREWTGDVWLVVPIQGGGEASLYEQEQQAKQAAIEKAWQDPAVLAIKANLPEITITDLKTET